MSLPKGHRPGTRWRTLAWEANDEDPRLSGAAIASSDVVHPGSTFDELVVDRWFHMEQMNDRDWWVCFTREDGTDLVVNVHVGEHGRASSVQVEEDP